MSEPPGGGTDGGPTGGRRRAGLLLPLASAQQAVEVASVLGVVADAVPSSRGVLLLPRAREVDAALAGRVSRSLRRAEVLVLRLADERVAVERWRAGRLVDTPHYGLVGGVDGDAERVLLGFLEPAAAAGAASTDGVDRRAATRSVLARATGPVRGWQVGVLVVGVVAASLLTALAVLDVLAPDSGTLDVVVLVVWALLTAFWAAQLRALLRRRRREREAGGAGDAGGAGGAGAPPG